MTAQRLQEKIDLINASITFWEEQGQKIINKMDKNNDYSESNHQQLYLCFHKIELEEQQLDKVESEYNLYLQKLKKIRRGHHQKSLLI